MVSFAFLLIAAYMLFPANLAVKLYVPFLLKLTFTFATPFASVVAVYVLPFTVNVIFLLATTFPLADLKVAVSVFVFALAVYDLFGTVKIPFCLFTTILATANDPL